MPVHSNPRRKRRKQLWDGLTITLALAVVLLGLAIFFFPKAESRSNTSPAKQVPASMAVVSPASSNALFS